MTPLYQFATKTVLVASVLTFASPAFAEPNVAQSFEQLQVLVSVGNKVKVIDSAGNRVAGKIDAISNSQLILNVNGTQRTLDERDVREIRHRGGDSLKNGAWWGFGVGAGLGTLVYATWCTVEPCPGSAVAIIPIYGGLGAAIGVGVDALIRGENAVYRAPGKVALSVTPIFGRRSGVGVSLSF